MEELSSASRSLIEENREAINMRFHAANSRFSGRLEGGQVSQLFLKYLNVFSGKYPQCSAKLVLSLFETILEIQGRKSDRIVPEFHGHFFRWVEAASEIIYASPKKSLARMANALIRLHSDGSDVQKFVTFSTQKPVLQFREKYFETGILIAWVCGMASLREHALHLLQNITFPDEVIATVFNTDQSQKELARRWERDRWYHPAGINEQGGKLLKLGGFRSFPGNEMQSGGFLQPPVLLKAGSTLYAKDPFASFRIYADCYGLSLSRDEIPTEAAVTGKEVSLKGLDALTHSVKLENTVFASTAYSHSIFILRT